MKKLTTIDLFAGAGGLSYGFLKTNAFEIKLAVENNKYAKETYLFNHPNTMIEDDINTVDFNSIMNQFGNIDVVIGGPPCQGFSNANRQRNYLVSPKNQLIKKYIDAVEIINPNIVVMENVKTISSDRHKFIYSHADEKVINDLGIQLSKDNLLIGLVPMKPYIFLNFIIENLNENLGNYLLPGEINIIFNQLYKKSSIRLKYSEYIKKNRKKIDNILESWDLGKQIFWCDEYKNLCKNIKKELLKKGRAIDLDNLRAQLNILIETNKTISKTLDIVNYCLKFENIRIDNDSILITVETYNIIDYVTLKLRKMGYSMVKGILNAADFGVPQSRERFILLGIKENLLKREFQLPTPIINKGSYVRIGEAIGDLKAYKTQADLSTYKPLKRIRPVKKDSDFLKYVIDSDELHNHITTDTRETALTRFKALKQGENFHNLEEHLKTTYTTPSRTQNTIYKRLELNKTSDTVVNVRKSMWIHPELDRAISIREAARLQSFPDSFVFCGTKDSQYQQIGNAVPPLLGKAIAEQILCIIGLK